MDDEFILIKKGKEWTMLKVAIKLARQQSVPFLVNVVCLEVYPQIIGFLFANSDTAFPQRRLNNEIVDGVAKGRFV